MRQLERFCSLPNRPGVSFHKSNINLRRIDKTADVLTIRRWITGANDCYECVFFRRIWTLLQLVLTHQSTAALTSMCLFLHKHDFFCFFTQLNICVFFSYFFLIYLFVSQDMLDVFEAIQGKFRQIRSLTQRQKDHLKRFHGGSDTSNGNVNIYQKQFHFAFVF